MIPEPDISKLSIPDGFSFREHQVETFENSWKTLMPPVSMYKQLAVLPTGAGKCVNLNTLVWSNGLRRIGDIYGCHSIQGIDSLKEIDSWWNDKTGNGLFIGLESGHNIDGTLDHKIWVKDKNNIEHWKKLKDLKIGDLVKIVIGSASFGSVVPTDKQILNTISNLKYENECYNINDIPTYILFATKDSLIKFFNQLYTSVGKPVLRIKSYFVSMQISALLMGLGIANCVIHKGSRYSIIPANIDTLCRILNVNIKFKFIRHFLNASKKYLIPDVDSLENSENNIIYYYSRVNYIGKSTSYRVDCFIPDGNSFIGNNIINHNTSIFVNLPQLYSTFVKDKKMLILAHRDKLLDQAKEDLLKWNPESRVSIDQGERVPDIENSDVIIASVQSLGPDDQIARLSKYNPDDFWCVVIDEAHHSVSKTYLNILQYFGFIKIEEGRIVKLKNSKLLFGVTATDRRSDNKGLSLIFDTVIIRRNLRQMIDNKFLVPIDYYRVRTDADISSVSSSGDELNLEQLSKEVDTPNRNDLVVKAWLAKGEGRQTAVYAVNKRHVSNLADKFIEYGVDARIITEETKGEDRNSILRDFDNEVFPVSVSCGVLTEGWDSQKCSCIVLARPMKSESLYQQIIGRGLRTLMDGGSVAIDDSTNEWVKKNCIILDLVDNHKENQIISLPTLFGLPNDFELEEVDVREVADKVKELSDKAPWIDISKIKTIDELSKKMEKIDILNMPDPESDPASKISDYLWIRTSADEYKLPVIAGEYLSIKLNELDNFDIYRNSGNKSQLLLTESNPKDAILAADNLVKKLYPEYNSLISRHAEWRDTTNGTITRKQLTLLKRSTGLTEKELKNLSIGKASVLISMLSATGKIVKREIPFFIKKKLNNKKVKQEALAIEEMEPLGVFEDYDSICT